MHQLRRLIHLCNVYTKHGALDLLHSTDMHARIGGGIGASISDTDTRLIPVVLAEINTG